MISPSTIAAATRVVQYAAMRPIVPSPGLMPSSKAAAQGADVGNADGLGAIAAQVPSNTERDKSLAADRSEIAR